MIAGTIGLIKFKRLARRLGGTRSAAGVLELLWLAVGANADDGAIGRAFADEDIAEAVDWPIDQAAELVEALVEERWLDRHPEFRLIVHDWSQHAPNYIHKRLRKQSRCFADGFGPFERLARRKSARDDGDEEANGDGVEEFEHESSPGHARGTTFLPQGMPGGRPTKPSQAKPNPTQPRPARPGADVQCGHRESGPPAERGSPPGQPAEAWEIFVETASELARKTALRVHAGAARELLHCASAEGVPRVWLMRWVEAWCAKKRKQAQTFTVNLLLHAAREDLAVWCATHGEWTAMPPAPPGLVFCASCGKNSYGWVGGDVVPCYCRPPRRKPGLEPVGAAAVLAAAH